MDLRLLDVYPSNKAFHNLCTTLTPPPGTKQLLGLGLKYCLEHIQPETKIDQDQARFIRDIRLHYWLLKERPYSAGYNPKLYINSDDWDPPLCSDKIEKELKLFVPTVKKWTIDRESTRKNITYFQQHALEHLASDPRFRIMESDKNLGPCIMETIRYMQALYDEHLSSDSYRRMTQEEAYILIEASLILIKEVLYLGPLTRSEHKCFERAFKQAWRIHQFKGMPKMHKEREISEPIKFRPLTSCAASPFEPISKFVDEELQPIARAAHSHLDNSQQCKDEIEALQPLPPNAMGFTSDAVGMYPNLDTVLGINATKEWLENESDMSQPRIDLVIKLLTFIMETNVLQFGDTYWLQLIGTATGTSCAVVFATISFLKIEKQILARLSHRLLYYRRFIDDIIGFWLTREGDLNPERDPEWILFKSMLDTFGRLHWLTSPLSPNITFLDLEISIEELGKVSFKTHIKERNLHLYIPAGSAHPPGCLKGTIYGNIDRYWRQNSKREDFVSLTADFANHLQARGYKADTIITVFKDAAKHIKDKTASSTQSRPMPSENDNIDAQNDRSPRPIFLHSVYHPLGVPRRHIHQAFNENLKVASIQRLTIAYSRPTNVGDRLSKSKLQDNEFIPPMSEIVATSITRKND